MMEQHGTRGAVPKPAAEWRCHPSTNVHHRSNTSVHRNILASRYGVVRSWDLYTISKSSKDFVRRLKRYKTLVGHSGCVNTLAWNETGSLLLTGSDDYLLNIYDAGTTDLLHSVESGHRANVFCAKFLPCTSDLKIVSCSGDGMLQYNELGSTHGLNYFNCHSGTTYEVVVTPGDPNTFLSCGEDGTVRHFDLRTKNKCHCQECAEDILIDARHAVNSISINPMLPYHIAIGCKDSHVRVFDRRMLGTSSGTRSVNRNRGWMPGLFCKFKPSYLKPDSSRRVTSLKYSRDGNDLLVNYSTDYLYLFTVKDGPDSDVTGSMETEKRNGCHDTTHGDEVTTKHHYNDSDSSNCSDEDLPPVKRLRLRGDWSDTGPQARPEADEDVTPENNIMQRMSVLFSRWIEDAMSATIRTASSSSSDDETSIEPIANLNRRTNSVSQHVASNQHRQEDSNRGRYSLENNDQQHGATSRSDNVIPNDAENLSNAESTVSNTGLNISNSVLNSGLHVTGNEIPDSAQSDSNFSNEESAGSERAVAADDSPVYVPTATLSRRGNITSDDPGDVEQQVMPRMNENPDDAMESSNAIETNVEPRANSLESTETGQSRQTFDDEEVRNAQSALFTAQFRQRIRALNTPANRYTNERQFAASKIQNFIRLHRSRKLDRNNSDVINKPEHVYMPQHRMVYKGHRNARTMIKEANFWGDDFVLSGSDCGRIFIWDRHTGELVMFLEGDSHVVNRVQPHPFEPILASSGIDHDVKLWAPLLQEPPDLTSMDEIVKRNEKMLEEGRDTITVPAAFVLRMFASLGSIRRNRRRNENTSDE